MRASQLGALWKCTSRLEGNYEVSNCTNLNHASNNKHCRPQVQFLPLSLVVPQFFIKGNSSNTPILFDIRELWFHTLHYVAWRRELKHVKFHLRETCNLQLSPLLNVAHCGSPSPLPALFFSLFLIILHLIWFSLHMFELSPSSNIMEGVES